MVVEDVPHHRAPEPGGEAEHVAQRERAVVVVDHEAGAGGVGEQREAAEEAVESRLPAPGGAADVQHDDGLGPEAHAVEDLRLELEVAHRRGLDVRVLGVQHDVLAGVGGEPEVALAGQRADGGELLGALVDLGAERRELGVGGVGGERRRHPVHADALGIQVVEDRPQVPEGVAQVRAGPPAPCVVRGQATRAEDLDGEAQAHGEPYPGGGRGDAPGRAGAYRGPARSAELASATSTFIGRRWSGTTHSMS